MTDTKRTITLTDRPPVRIVDADWPTIGKGSVDWYDNEHRFRANRTRDIFVKVRQHADGRVIVYAGYETSSSWVNETDSKHRTGELLEAGGNIVEALHRVARELASRANAHQDEIRDCMNQCIASMPAEEI